jgi:hypothetical protein
VQFRLTTLVHSEFQNHARINDHTEVSKSRSPEVTRGCHINRKKVTLGDIHARVQNLPKPRSPEVTRDYQVN